MLPLQHQSRYVIDKVNKIKVHTKTGHEAPEGEQRCSSTLSVTMALDGGA